jgi:DNA-binding transcriptional LysR family regulator
MELRHLRYFVAIAEERSFTRATERLWVAQPGLSTQMRRLEAELGVQLFERHTRGVDLTQAGELFLARARVAIAAAETAAATGGDLEAGVIGTVRLGLASGARWHRASDLLHEFSRARPGVELTVLEAYGGMLWRELRDRRLDALLAPTGQASADLRTLKLGSDGGVVLVGTGHRLAGIGPVLAELGVAAELVPGGPGPALNAEVAADDLVALTTTPDALPASVVARPLHPPRRLSFELLDARRNPLPRTGRIHPPGSFESSAPVDGLAGGGCVSS